MDSCDKNMEDHLRETVAKACRQLMRSLEQEPDVILESEDIGDIPDSHIGEISSWVFRRRCKDGYPDNGLGK